MLGEEGSVLPEPTGDGGSGGTGDYLEGDRSTGGNRWPRQETLALLKIRSDMDGVFRDSSLKGPLWEDISRKMAELGYHRSSKKCKEKFENVYKYHKRTKDGRVGKSDGKTYKFFDEIEALEKHHPSLPPSSAQDAVPIAMMMPAGAGTAPAGITVTSAPDPHPHPHPHPTQQIYNQQQQPIQMENGSSPSGTPSSSSSTSSDDEEVVLGRGKKKRKWKDMVEGLMKEVIHKQEKLQEKFLEAFQRREQDRLVREEAWKAQEMSRLNREHEILVHERAMAAAKDAALVDLLKKFSDRPQPQLQPQPREPQPKVVQVNVQESPVSLAIPVSSIPPQFPPHLEQQQSDKSNVVMSIHESGNGGSSRWPKAEIDALINIRTKMDEKYQENTPKGPLWEDISTAMKQLGYNRNPKRCKEKWENINKYFKKVKESNKKRPQDSKTCPYFEQLDALYQKKTSTVGNLNTAAGPIIAQPQAQWPGVSELDSYDKDEDDEDEDDENDDDDDQGIGGYEIVPNNNNNNNGVNSIITASITTTTTATTTPTSL